MECVYAAMLLHKAGQKVSEAGLNKVLEAAGIKPDAAKVKSVVAALEGVDIEKAIKEAATLQVAVAAPPAGTPSEAGKQEAKAEPKKEEDKKAEEAAAAAGLSALFG